MTPMKPEHRQAAQDAINLKPCPMCCADAAECIGEQQGPKETDPMLFIVECGSCDAQSNEHTDAREAAVEWNALWCARHRRGEDGGMTGC